MENKKFRPWPRPGLGVSTGEKIKQWLIAAGVLLALVIIASIALVMRHDGLIMKAVNTAVRRPLPSGGEQRMRDWRFHLTGPHI